MAADISDPFGVFAGQFTQIPLNSNAPLIPYGDLQASGSYGRGLVLPDDIIPTLGLQTLIGSKNGAKLWTGQHVDGAADVFVVGQSGGGGGGSGFAPPVQAASFTNDVSAASYVFTPTNWHGATKLYALSVSVVIDTSGPAWTNGFTMFNAGLKANPAEFWDYIFCKIGIGGTAGAPNPTTAGGSFTFPGGFPLTGADGLTSTGITLYLENGAKGFFGGSYIVG